MQPEQKTKTTPKDFFIYLGTVATLYVSAISLLTLWFHYIDTLFPDRLEYVDPFSGAIRFSIASLIIVFPLYLFFTRYINKDIRQNSGKKDIGIRKWVLYLTLFIGGITIVGDLIALINVFLGGELTSRFILKVLAILVVIGGAFWYYFEDLRGAWEHKTNVSKAVGMFVSAVVLISIIGGFFIIGSPQTAREIQFDIEKINDLQSIQFQVVRYWQQKEALPEELIQLEDPLVGFIVPSDPQTDAPYTYTVTGEKAFELCATFNQKSRGNVRARSPFGFEEENWDHEAGEACFERTIDPDRFPPQSEILKPLPR